MPITQTDASRQMQDLSLTKAKLKADFLEGGDLNLTGGSNDATITGLKAGVNPNDAINKAQFDAAIGGISGDLINKGALDASLLGSQLDNVENGWWYKITVAGTLFGTNPIELAVGDNLYCQNTVIGTPTDGADFFKIDNTESADILRTGDVVNDLTTGGIAVPLSAQQGVVLKGLVDDNATDIGTNTTNIGTNTTNIGTNASDISALQANWSERVFGEIPVVTNASAVLAALANIPVKANTAQVYLNGMRMRSGAGNDYTIVEATGVITFEYTLKNPKDVVLVDYEY